MSKLRIKTCDEFESELRAVPVVQARLASLESRVRNTTVELRPYALWSVLLEFVNEAIETENWKALKDLLRLYEGVELVGKRSEMFEASYVAFLEDVKLPTDPRKLREVWRHSTPGFAAEIKRLRSL